MMTTWGRTSGSNTRLVITPLIVTDVVVVVDAVAAKGAGDRDLDLLPTLDRASVGDVMCRSMTLSDFELLEEDDSCTPTTT